jgi:hypothetical protein
MLTWMGYEGRPKRISSSVNYNVDAHWDELVGVSQEGRSKRGEYPVW